MSISNHDKVWDCVFLGRKSEMMKRAGIIRDGWLSQLGLCNNKIITASIEKRRYTKGMTHREHF